MSLGLTMGLTMTLITLNPLAINSRLDNETEHPCTLSHTLKIARQLEMAKKRVGQMPSVRAKLLENYDLNGRR